MITLYYNCTFALCIFRLQHMPTPITHLCFALLCFMCQTVHDHVTVMQSFKRHDKLTVMDSLPPSDPQASMAPGLPPAKSGPAYAYVDSCSVAYIHKSCWYCFPNLNLISPSKSNRWLFYLCSPPRRQWLIVHENDCITVHCMINYEDLYFHVITLCSLDVTVNFLGKWFPALPEKNGPYAYEHSRSH